MSLTDSSSSMCLHDQPEHTTDSVSSSHPVSSSVGSFDISHNSTWQTFPSLIQNFSMFWHPVMAQCFIRTPGTTCLSADFYLIMHGHCLRMLVNEPVWHRSDPQTWLASIKGEPPAHAGSIIFLSWGLLRYTAGLLHLPVFHPLKPAAHSPVYSFAFKHQCYTFLFDSRTRLIQDRFTSLTWNKCVCCTIKYKNLELILIFAKLYKSLSFKGRSHPASHWYYSPQETNWALEGMA